LSSFNLRTEVELRKMRRAGLVVWRAHRLAGSLVEPGITTGEIDAAVERFFECCGAEPLFKGVPGVVPFPAVTCMSVNEEVVHGIPGERELAEGDIVSIDTGARLDGWCGDACVSHRVGEVSADKERLLDVTLQTLELAIEAMATATYWREVAAKMEAYVIENGFSVVEKFVGHGIGREMHQPPQVPNYVTRHYRRSDDFRLEPGLVIAVEPMVNAGTKQVRGLSDHWTVVTLDRKPSAQYEHTIALTSEGPWVLTGPPTDKDEQSFVDSLSVE
jgi:methionyl aminopeptidase